MSQHLFETVARFGSGSTLEKCEFCGTLRCSRSGAPTRYTRRLSRGDYAFADFELPCSMKRPAEAAALSPEAKSTTEPEAEVTTFEWRERLAVQQSLSFFEAVRV
jgi:hypothetical protein